MQRSDSVAGLERLADAFSALALDAPDLMVDRDTRAPADAVGWHAGRNFRVRVRGHAASGQASGYYRVGGAGLELMTATSRSGPQARYVSDDGAADGAWSSAGVPLGEEPQIARLVLQRLRRRVR